MNPNGQEDDPLRAMVDGAMGVNPVGAAEVMLRQQLGDARFDEIKVATDRQFTSATVYIEARSRFWGALAGLMSTLSLAVILLTVAGIVYIFVR